jgi:hypothetical protein
MNKIIEVALAGKFTADAVPSIMEIIGATPNPEMATEILLGVYEKPVLKDTGVRNNVVLTLISADYWNNSVIYEYQDEIKKSFYVHKDTDKSLITLDNYKEYQIDWRDEGSEHMELLTGEVVTRRVTCDIFDWKSYSENKVELAAPSKKSTK